MLEQRCIVLTGASGDVGSELITHFHNLNYKVLCQIRSIEKIRDLAIKGDISSWYPEHVFQADLTNEKDVEQFTQWANKKSCQGTTKGIWGVINLAGTSSNSMSWKLSIDEFHKIVNANLLTTFLSCRNFVPIMRSQNYGRIINVSSVVASSGVAGASHYAAAKAGIEGFTRSLALEVANKNITVNALALGYLDCGIIRQVTPEIQTLIKNKIPIKRFGTVEEVAGALNYLLSDSAAYMTGQVLHLNGGYQL